jgi:hypothetical protein
MIKRLAFSILALSVLACSIQSRLPVMPTPVFTVQQVTPSIEQVYFGHVLGQVNIRNAPEGAGSPSWIIGALKKGDYVRQDECQDVGNSVWVRHALGWSLARSESTVYIKGVCEQ